MYHGATVPGFPQHPHRGFETVTLVRRGFIDHSDSLGATARFGNGDVQWLTAGNGIVHCEMFPLLDNVHPNPLELFQIWVNLPAADKRVDPYFTMLWDQDIPRHVAIDEAGRRTEVTVIAGALEGVTALPPPPNSWASRPESDLAIWHVRMEPGARWELPAARGPETVRTLYAFEGATLQVAGHELPVSTGVLLQPDVPVELLAGAEPVEWLLLQARPIAEPVAQYGPFVMNDQAEIAEAFADYRRTGFGGWPWPVDDPTHGTEPERFARRARARVDPPAARAVHCSAFAVGTTVRTIAPDPRTGRDQGARHDARSRSGPGHRRRHAPHREPRLVDEAGARVVAGSGPARHRRRRQRDLGGRRRGARARGRGRRCRQERGEGPVVRRVVRMGDRRGPRGRVRPHCPARTDGRDRHLRARSSSPVSSGSAARPSPRRCRTTRCARSRSRSSTTPTPSCSPNPGTGCFRWRSFPRGMSTRA